GSAREGWTKRKAEAALKARQTDVERDGFRQPERTGFEAFAEDWLAEYPVARNLKASTVESYKAIVESHLVPAFRSLALGQVDADEIGRYVTRKMRAGLKGRTVNRHLNVLSQILGAAARPPRRLIPVNPVQFVDRPRETEVEWRILTPEEIREVAAQWQLYI